MKQRFFTKPTPQQQSQMFVVNGVVKLLDVQFQKPIIWATPQLGLPKCSMLPLPGTAGIAVGVCAAFKRISSYENNGMMDYAIRKRWCMNSPGFRISNKEMAVLAKEVVSGSQLLSYRDSILIKVGEEILNCATAALSLCCKPGSD
jgi:hypothetical protein